MSDNRKYYYLKLKENFYNSETMVILESMQDGLLYSNLLLKMYLMSLKSGGILMLNDHLPHTPQTIATFTRHQVGTVERALKVFLEFGLVEILTDGAYYMADIQLLIGQSSTEGERKKKERMRLKRQKLLPSGGADICPPYSQGDICPPEIRDKRLDIRDKSIENRYIGVCAQAELDDTQTHTKKKKTTRFVPPTVEEVKQYCEENNYKLDAQRFVDFYESKGWMIGKNKMKSWQAAVRTWTRKAKEGTKQDEEDRGESTSVRLW